MTYASDLHHVDDNGLLMACYRMTVHLHDGEEEADAVVGHDLILDLTGV